MNLTIDIGNSSIKSGLFEEDKLIEVKRFDDLKELSGHYKELDQYQIGICSVRHSKQEILEELPILNKALFLSPATPIPLGLNYDTPDTLGMDRLAAAMGAYELFPDQPVLVIDLGTCITIDWVSNDSFQGGFISPGIKMRFKAMHKFTANLPLLTAQEVKGFLGKSTTESMNNGVIYGIVGEIEHHISQLMLKNPDLKVIMTGGDAQLFESKIKSDIFVAPEIVLLGLNGVLKYNA